MKVKIGAPVKEKLNKVRKFLSTAPDPEVYEYPIKGGMVLIRRESKECMYLKGVATKGGSQYIMLYGKPEEFIECKTIIENKYSEAEVIDWEEVEEMIAWAKEVPVCS